MGLATSSIYKSYSNKMRKFKGHYQRAIETVCVVQTKSEVPSTFLWCPEQKDQRNTRDKSKTVKTEKGNAGKGVYTTDCGF